ncbi:hypothetical protein H5410_005350 [Solanum commersonii]|uniref:Uncharacterized protein n=1 Tax=Solanum commersonii TaxID=4109 RepID=A0A9J6A7C3_SOLCO|nr:hypothetical protein H5410_005350 [Solanum commersonii]
MVIIMKQRHQYNCDDSVNHESLRSIINHLSMMNYTLFGSGALLVLLLIILIHVLIVNKVRLIHSMVDEAKSLGDNPSYEALYMFRKMV